MLQNTQTGNLRIRQKLGHCATCFSQVETIIFCFLCFLVLAGCQTAEHINAKQALEKGYNGFTGFVRPIATTLKTSVGPIQFYSEVTTIQIRNPDGDENIIHKYEGELLELDDRFVWNRKMKELEINGRKVDRKNNETFWTVQTLLDKSGNPTGITEVFFPGPIEKELSLTKRNAVINNASKAMEGQYFLPKREISQGDDWLEFGKFLEKAFPDVAFSKSNIVSRIIGTTQKFGRVAVVTVISGNAIGWMARPNDTLISVSGHQVNDLGTGLQVSHMAGMNLFVEGKKAKHWHTFSRGEVNRVIFGE